MVISLWTRTPGQNLSWCTGSQGNNHCSFFVQESLVSCYVLFGSLYRLFWTGTRGQNPHLNPVVLWQARNLVEAETAEIWKSHWVERQQYLGLSVNIQDTSVEVVLNKAEERKLQRLKKKTDPSPLSIDSFCAILILTLSIMQTSLIYYTRDFMV